MYTREQLIALVQDHAATHEMYPFNKINSHETIIWTVMKHNASNKITAMIF